MKKPAAKNAEENSMYKGATPMKLTKDIKLITKI
jgi:hypothetical protein